MLPGKLISCFKKIMSFGQNNQSSSVQTNPPTYSIALMISGYNYVSEQINEAFVKTIQEGSTQTSHSATPGKAATFTFKLFDTEGKSALAHSYSRDITHGNFDLIFSLGSGCTQALFDMTTLSNSITPIVFGCVVNPVEQGMIASLESSGNHMTGVAYVGMHYAEQITLLAKLKADMKNILVLYNPNTPGSRNQMLIVKKLIEQRGLATHIAHLTTKSDIYTEIVPKLSSVDVILTLRDHEVRQHMSTLAQVCNELGVTLVASDTESVNHGAAIGFGQPSFAIGIEAGKKALEILEKKKKPTNIPVTIAKIPYKVALNLASMEKQRTPLDPNILLLMQYTEVI